MPLIKRYANRKLYDTAARTYISLEHIAEMIRRGIEVQVVDHVTGEDVTVLVLSQIIAEQARAGDGAFSRGTLTALIRAGGDALAVLRPEMAAPFDLARPVEEEIGRRIEWLVWAGELAADEAGPLRERLLSAGDEADVIFLRSAAAVRRVVARRGIAGRADMQLLADRLAALEAEVAALIAARHVSGHQNVTAS